MKLSLHFLLLGLAFTGYAQTNVIYGNVGNYGLVPQPRVNVTVTLISPNPRTVGDFVIRQDPISTLSSSNGYFAFTNLLWGDYTYTVAGVRGTTFKLQVQTNSNGTIPIGALTPTSEAYLPDPATNYYTMSQVDSLLAGVTGGTSGTTNTFRVLNVKELGAVGDGTTDDSAAIQRAINLASTNDLALADLYYPPGKYKVATSLIIPSNCPTTVLKASTGPLRMFGAGSSSSIILSYVTEGATLDATCPGNYANNMGLKLERMGITGPAVRDVTQTGHSIGLNLGWHDDTSAGQNQYRGDSIMLQDVAIDGFYMAITSTNVWGLTVDNCMFQSNQVAALALSKTHSAIIRNTSIRGVDLAGRFTGTGIGFYAPRGSDTSWGFGDTALLMGVRTYFCTNAIYNDELQLTDIGGNYQFSHTFYTIRSGMRTNAVMQKWHPWATLNGVVFCDSTTGYHNGGNATARCETDSAAAPFITLINYMGDVCVPGNRTDWNVLGATPSDGNVDSTSGYWTFGTANAAQPQVIGGKNLTATLNSGATFTFYTVSNLMAVATAGMVTNNASGLTLSGTWSGNVSLVDGASEASISREGDTTAFLDFTLGDYTVRQTQTNWQFGLPLVGNASGLTNFTFDTLQTFNDITNTGSLYNSGSILGFGGLNIRGGNVIATNGTATFGDVSGTFTGNGGGLTNLTLATSDAASSSVLLPASLDLYTASNTYHGQLAMNQQGAIILEGSAENGFGILADGGVYFQNPNGTLTLNADGSISHVNGGITSDSFTGAHYGNGSGLTNLNLATATGLLPMGTVATQYQTAPGPFLSTNANGRGYTYNGGGLTNFQTIRAGSAVYTLTDNTEKFFAWSGSVSSGGETYAAAPMALGGTFSKFYLAVNQIVAGGTNITVKLYTNGVYCGLGATLRGPGTSTNELSTVTGVVPDGALVSLGVQSSYNGTHPLMYFRWSWVSTK